MLTVYQIIILSKPALIES